MNSLHRIEWQRRGRRGALAAALAAIVGIAAAVPAGAVGLVYVDAFSDDDGLTGTFGANANLAPQSAFSTGFTPDNLWGYRGTLGAESPTFSRYIWEAGGTTAGSNVEDAPEITQTISGLTPSASYDVYVAYWSSGANWGINAGFTSGTYQLFDRTGTGGAIAGTPAATAIWTTPPTNALVPIFTEADRAMYLGKVGTTSANAQGRISVFLNDRPNTTDADRTWLDGLAYVPAGTAITYTATVNRATGNLSIVNNTGEPLRFTAYSLTSAASALRPANWLTIQDNYVGTGPGDLDTDPWAVSAPTPPLPAYASPLSEIEFGSDGATLPTGGGTFNLGNVWARSPFEDVQVQFTLVGGGTFTVVPQFTGTPIATGDFNADGSLNLADYLNLRDHMQMNLTSLALTRVENYLMGDLTGDAQVDFADFTAFRNSYIQANGPGSFEAMLAAVPEPGSAALAALAGLALVAALRRRAAPGGSELDNQPADAATLHGVRETTMIFRRGTGNDRLLHGVCAVGCLALALLAGASACATARGEIVDGWGIEPSSNDGAVTEGVPGSFTTTAPGSDPVSTTNNLAVRALLDAPISLANVGDVVQLTGVYTPTGAINGNQQFRFGLFNTNGHAPGALSGGVWTGADTLGWQGYQVQLGNSGVNDAVKGRDAATGNWFSNTGTYTLSSFASPTAPPGGTPYNFSFQILRTGATSMEVSYSFVGGAVNRSGTIADNAMASSAMTAVNAVGFFGTNSGSGGAMTMSNVTVVVPELLRLRVNTTNGFAAIANPNAATIALNYYEIASTAGALAPATWMSIDGNAPASTTSWEKAGGSTANILSETNLLGTLSMGAAAPHVALGRVFSVGGTQDLRFRYALPDGTLKTGIVQYVAGGPAGDFDVDGDVDGRDFLAWQRGLGGAFTGADLTSWRTTFGMTSALAAGSPVPEPAATWLGALSAIAVVNAARRRRDG